MIIWAVKQFVLEIGGTFFLWGLTEVPVQSSVRDNLGQVVLALVQEIKASDLQGMAKSDAVWGNPERNNLHFLKLCKYSPGSFLRLKIALKEQLKIFYTCLFFRLIWLTGDPRQSGITYSNKGGITIACQIMDIGMSVRVAAVSGLGTGRNSICAHLSPLHSLLLPTSIPLPVFSIMSV